MALKKFRLMHKNSWDEFPLVGVLRTLALLITAHSPVTSTAFGPQAILKQVLSPNFILLYLDQSSNGLSKLAFLNISTMVDYSGNKTSPYFLIA